MTPDEKLIAAAERLERLINGEPGYAGDAQWCQDWTYTAVRHVQRNMDIECPVHQPWGGPDRSDECGRWGRYDGTLIVTLRAIAPALVVLLRAVADNIRFDSIVRHDQEALAIADAILAY